MDIENLFPTPIGHLNNIEFTNRVLPIANSILEKTGDDHVWGYKSTFGDVKIREYLKSFTWIEDYIKEISYEYVKTIGFKFKHKITTSSLFVSRIPNIKNHGVHNHPNAVLSGVMYLDTTPNCAPLLLTDPKSVRSFNNLEKLESTMLSNASEIFFEPIKGDIVLFESWVPHAIPHDKKEGYRTTLVFNLSYIT